MGAILTSLPVVRVVEAMFTPTPVVKVALLKLTPLPVVTAESKTISPRLYVRKVKSEELKLSPATRYRGAAEVIYEAVGLIKVMS